MPPPLQSAFQKQLDLFLDNVFHPSVNLKKMKGSSNLWRGKVTKGYRFIVELEENQVTFLRIGPHDILNKP